MAQMPSRGPRAARNWTGGRAEARLQRSQASAPDRAAPRRFACGAIFSAQLPADVGDVHGSDLVARTAAHREREERDNRAALICIKSGIGLVVLSLNAFAVPKSGGEQ